METLFTPAVQSGEFVESARLHRRARPRAVRPARQAR